jgi:hypothetical protein
MLAFPEKTIKLSNMLIQKLFAGLPIFLPIIILYVFLGKLANLNDLQKDSIFIIIGNLPEVYKKLPV